MKTIVRERFGIDAVELREVPKPEIGDDQVLVRVHASSVNPVEWYGVYAPPFMRVMSGQLRRPHRSTLGADLAPSRRSARTSPTSAPATTSSARPRDRGPNTPRHRRRG